MNTKNKTLKNEPGLKYDADKPRMDLLPPEAMIGLAQVLSYGAAKYDEHNWRNGMSYSRLMAALQRHYTAFAMGEDIDQESGLPHIDHMMCCAAFLSTFQKTGTGTDDRYKANG